MTTTKLMQNMMWAIDRPEAERTAEVQEEREEGRSEHDLGRRQQDEDEQVGRSAAAEVVADERHGDQVPRMTEASVAIRPTLMLAMTASPRKGGPNGWAQCRWWPSHV